MESPKIWRITDLMAWSTDYLQQKQIDDARSSVEWMLCDVLDCSRVQLYMNFDRPLDAPELQKFKSYLLLCAAHKPVQQIIGQTEFYGLKLVVDEHVLIPRPETELLVDEVLRIFREGCYEEYRILDIGAGSGAMSIAVARHLPNARIEALEKSVEACKVMERNIRYHNLSDRIHIIREDVNTFSPDSPYTLIMSNPPYISEPELAGLDKRVSHYEPYMALSDGGDGLSFYKLFAAHFKHWLSAGGAAVLEFGGKSQETQLKDLFREYRDLSVIRDYQDCPRILSLLNPDMSTPGR